MLQLVVDTKNVSDNAHADAACFSTNDGSSNVADNYTHWCLVFKIRQGKEIYLSHIIKNLQLIYMYTYITL